MTGSSEKIGEVTKAYRVYFSQGPPDDEKDYIVRKTRLLVEKFIFNDVFFIISKVDHTIITYLVNPDGEFVDYYGQTKKAHDMAAAIAIHMSTWDLKKKS